MKNNINNNGNTKLILLHPYIQKQTNPNRILFIALISIFTLVTLLTLVYTRESFHTTTTTTRLTATTTTTTNHHKLPKNVMKALIHYASQTNSTNHMSFTDIKQIADTLSQCPPPCNFLIFGLSPETLLWNALNHYGGGRTVFIDENRYYAAYIEEKHPEIEAYDVQYTTKISELKELVKSVREQTHNECRPVQNLLFSDCKIGLNDLPNQLYELDWDVILVDGPRGYWPAGPGSMSAIFTAGVLARSKKGGNDKTHVFVHDYNREVERVSSEEFLCKENLVKSSKDLLAHFVVERVAMEEGGNHQFCRNHPPVSA